MKFLPLLLLLAAPLAAQQNTPADSADYRCVFRNIDTLRNANGGGRRNNLATRAQTCATRWFTRNDSVAPTPPPPPAPVAQLEGACAFLTCTFDASASTGPRLMYSWSCGTNCTPGNVAKFTQSYPASGSRSVTVEVTDSLNRKATNTKVFTIPGMPEDTVTPKPPPDSTPIDLVTRAALPRSIPSFSGLTVVRSYTVTTDLQRVLDTAKVGDEIRLGANFTGNFILPAKPCTGWITIRSVAAPPTQGTRVTPALAANFAVVTTPNSAPAFKTINPTCNWRFRGFTIRGTHPVTSVQYGMIWFGDGGWKEGGETQTDSTKVPQNFIFEQMYVDGSGVNSTRCLALNTGATVVRDSWFGECHASGFDSQAIAGWNGPGPYLIENNHLEAAGENVMFGGADPGIVGMAPSDITMRKNHFYKPLSWKGGPWSVKNCFELKTARRILLENNIFENSWPASQEGVCIVIKSNANGCQCGWLGTLDVTMRWNHIKNAAVGLALQGWDDSYGWNGGQHTQRVTMEQQLWENIGAEGSRQSLMLFTHDVKHILLAHQTMVHAPTGGGLVLPMAYSFGAARNVLFRDNVFTDKAGYAFHNSDNGSVHTNALKAFVSDGSWGFDRNVVGGMLPDYVSQNPPNSWYPATVAGIGMTADYSLSAASPYKGKGLNGADPGVDVAQLKTRLAGVASPIAALSRARSAPRPFVVKRTPQDEAVLAHQPRSP